MRCASDPEVRSETVPNAAGRPLAEQPLVLAQVDMSVRLTFELRFINLGVFNIQEFPLTAQSSVPSLFAPRVYISVRAASGLFGGWVHLIGS